MKTGKVDLTPRTRYLMGWAAGHEDDKGRTFEIEERNKVSRIYYSKVFLSEAAACIEAKKLKATGRKAYVRAYSYETSNPENAKGMPLLSTIERTFYFV